MTFSIMHPSHSWKTMRRLTGRQMSRKWRLRQLLKLSLLVKQDGYSIASYKCLQDVLSQILTLLYKDINATQSMPSGPSTAVISLLPKPGKDLWHMDDFRPLSLLNNVYKVFAKILAIRLEKVISSLIHLDQVGFIAGCHAGGLGRGRAREAGALRGL